MSSSKYPCALLINDIHVSKDNIPEFKKNWNEAVMRCQQLNIEDIVVGGDLWQARAAQTLDVLLAVKDVIEETTAAGICLTIAEGNHDLVDQEALCGYSHIFDGIRGVSVVSDYAVLRFGDKVDLYVMSYFPENGSFTKRYNEMLEIDPPAKSVKSVLYLHEGIKGGLAQPREDELPANMFKDFDAVLVGHYHDRKKIPGTNVEYIGASRQHNFGEDEEKGYTVLYTDGSYEFIKNEVNMRYKNIDVRYEDLNDKFYQSLEEIDGSRYKTKIRVSCHSEEAENIDKQKILDAGATRIEIVTEQTEVSQVKAHALDHKFDKAGIKDEYKSFCNNKEIDNEMGLRYLDKIN